MVTLSLSVGFNAIIVLWVRSLRVTVRLVTIVKSPYGPQPCSSFTSDTFHCKRQTEEKERDRGGEEKTKQKLGLGWLENVNVLEISQHVKQTKQGNYVGIVSRWFNLSSCWKSGKRAFWEASALIVSVFARVGRAKMSVKKVLLCSSVGTVVGCVCIYLAVFVIISGQICFSPMDRV